MYKALKKLDIPVDLVGISEIDVPAILSYGAIHIGNPTDVATPSEDIMKKYLIDRNIGYDFKKESNPVARWKGQKLVDLYEACIRLNNYGDISKNSY